MPALGSVTHIDAPIGAVFDLSQNFELRLEWDPLLREAIFVRGSAAASGSRVRLRYASGMTTTIEYFGFKRPSAIATKMVRGPRYFRQLVTNWHFRVLESGGTEVTFKCIYEARYRWLGWLVDPLVFSAISRSNRKRLNGLKRGVEEMGLVERLPARGE